MPTITTSDVILLVLRECAARGLVPKGYSTHPTAVEHAADVLVRALSVQNPDPPPALPPGRPELTVVPDAPTQLLPRYPWGQSDEPPRFQQGVASFPRGRG